MENNFSENLKRIRKECNLTQKQVEMQFLLPRVVMPTGNRDGQNLILKC